MYDWPVLKELWEHDKIPVEQAIGQLIVKGEYEHNLTVQTQRQQETQERKQEQQQHELDLLKRAVKALDARLKRLESQTPRPPAG